MYICSGILSHYFEKGHYFFITLEDMWYFPLICVYIYYSFSLFLKIKEMQPCCLTERFSLCFWKEYPTLTYLVSKSLSVFLNFLLFSSFFCHFSCWAELWVNFLWASPQEDFWVLLTFAQLLCVMGATLKVKHTARAASEGAISHVFWECFWSKKDWPFE